jgi:hypothetical protein
MSKNTKKSTKNSTSKLSKSQSSGKMPAIAVAQALTACFDRGLPEGQYTASISVPRTALQKFASRKCGDDFLKAVRAHCNRTGVRVMSFDNSDVEVRRPLQARLDRLYAGKRVLLTVNDDDYTTGTEADVGPILTFIRFIETDIDTTTAV